MQDIRFHRLAWGALVIICFAYAPIAMEYMLNLYSIESPQMWNSIYSMVTSETQALGPGSIAAEQHEWYLKSRQAMLIHTGLGGFLIIIAILQFSQRVRSRYPRIHRGLGRSYIILATIAMFSAFSYLVKTGPEHVFNGPAFYAQLWVLGFGVLSGAWIGLAFILKGKVVLHQMAMIFSFAMLLTTPFLRILWLFFGVLWPDVSQEVTNIAGGAMLGTFAVFGAIVATRCLDKRTAIPKNYRRLPGKELELSLGLLAIPAIFWITLRYLTEIGIIDRLLVTAIFAVTLVIVASAVIAHLARRNGRILAADEWRIHFLALLGSFPLFVLMWSLYELVFPVYDSFYATVLTGPGLAMTLGYMVVTYRRA